MSQLAREMKAFRKRHNISQATLAKLAGSYQSLICFAENDTRPTSDDLAARIRRVMSRKTMRVKKKARK